LAMALCLMELITASLTCVPPACRLQSMCGDMLAQAAPSAANAVMTAATIKWMRMLNSRKMTVTMGFYPAVLRRVMSNGSLQQHIAELKAVQMDTMCL